MRETLGTNVVVLQKEYVIYIARGEETWVHEYYPDQNEKKGDDGKEKGEKETYHKLLKTLNINCITDTLFVAVVIVVNIVADNYSDYDANNSEDDKNDDEANPSLLACRARRITSLLRILETANRIDWACQS